MDNAGDLQEEGVNRLATWGKGFRTKKTHQVQTPCSRCVLGQFRGSQGSQGG